MSTNFKYKFGIYKKRLLKTSKNDRNSDECSDSFWRIHLTTFIWRKRKLKENKRHLKFYFAFGSMLKVLDSYFIKQRDFAMEGKISSDGEWIRLCYDVSLSNYLDIGILELFHANISINKILSVAYSLFVTFNFI